MRRVAGWGETRKNVTIWKKKRGWGDNVIMEINPLMSNDHYSGRTAPLTSKRLHFIYLFNKYRY